VLIFRDYYKLKCPATATTRGEEVIGTQARHSHHGNPVQVEANSLRSAILTDGRTSVGSTNRNILGRRLVDLNQDVAAGLPKKSVIVRSLNRHKKSKVVLM
jgi:hypothetical protein